MSEFLSYFLNNSLLLGAFISIISSSITLLLQAYINKLLMERGKTSIYYKAVYNKITSNPWGFYEEIMKYILTYHYGLKFIIQKELNRL